MKKYLIVLLFVVAMSAATFGWIRHYRMEEHSVSWEDVVPTDPVMPDVQFQLSAQQLEVNFKRARQGDALAARLLSYHFGAVGNEAERLKWHIAAGNAGDCASILNLQYEKALSRA